jgi:hypothetical protein
MATRQRSRSARPPSPPVPPVISGDQLSGPPGSTEANEAAQESAVLRSSFDTEPYEGSGEKDADAPADAPKATFVGEQIIYKDRESRIAEAAYLRAQQRGFEPGYELEDWLAAEKEVDALLSSDGNQGTR